jgi:NitT/TauT family transport system ATP-binding protein
MTGKLEVTNLSYTFLTNSARPRVISCVLNDLTFEVNPGEVLGIIGPSGCGKTTFLNLIAAFIPKQEGEILLDGIPVQKPNSQRVMISQEQNLFLWMRALDNIAFGLKAKGVRKKERYAIAQDYLNMVGLGAWAEQYPHQLSGGMKQRLALARALAVEPAVMLMDEPFGALDAQSRKTLQDELLRLWSSTKPTTLLVTHDIEEAIYLSDRVMVLSHRPAAIREMISVPLPDHRTYGDRRTPEFLDLKAHIEDMLSPRQ